MSMAFEITPEDICTVLCRMGISCDLDSAIVDEAFELVSQKE